jgi:hypothetical protein
MREQESAPLNLALVLRDAATRLLSMKAWVDNVRLIALPLRCAGVAWGEEMAEEGERGPIEKLIDWLSRWKASFDWLRQRIGMLGAVAAILFIAIGGASLYVWSNWKEFKDRPGAAWLVEMWERRPVPPAPKGHLTIAVTHLQDDEGQKQEKQLRTVSKISKGPRRFRLTAWWNGQHRAPNGKIEKWQKRKQEACSSKVAPMF